MYPEINSKLKIILEQLVKNLDITETQYNNAVKSYQAVGSWLSDRESNLNSFHPEILPQGSFLLGTMIKPILITDSLDIDIVCKLRGKNPNWAQYHLKQAVGDRLKENRTYEEMLDEEGRRCWTLLYSDSSKFHMDILPSVVSTDYNQILEKAFNTYEFKDYNTTSIRITDNTHEKYFTETNSEDWQRSNPFGYAVWFQGRCQIEIRKSLFLNESINPVPKYQTEKFPLQRIIQIFKRHRDIMFKGDEHKPISIIITTLAAKAYSGETNIIEAIYNAVNNMESYIESRYSVEHGRNIKWISNPVNEEENFADKWVEQKIKEENFYKWLKKLKADIIGAKEKTEIRLLKESLSKSFGKDIIEKSINDLGTGLITTSSSVLSGSSDKNIDLDMPQKPPKPKREGFAK